MTPGPGSRRIQISLVSTSRRRQMLVSTTFHQPLHCLANRSLGMGIGQSTKPHQGRHARELAQTVQIVSVSTPSPTIGNSATLVSFMLVVIATHQLAFPLSCMRTQREPPKYCAVSSPSMDWATSLTTNTTRSGTSLYHHAFGVTRVGRGWNLQCFWAQTRLFSPSRKTGTRTRATGERWLLGRCAA